MSELKWIMDHFKDTKPYTTEEEQIVFRGYKENPTPELKYEIAAHNIGLVSKMANKWSKVSGNVVTIEDLLQEGYFGLLKAIDEFEPEKGNKFSTYAIWWIQQAIVRYIGNHSDVIRVPIHAVETRKRYEVLQNKQLNKTGSAYSFNEAVKILGLNKEQINTLRLSLRAADTVSADTVIGIEHNEETTLMHFIKDDTSEDAFLEIERRELRDTIESLISDYLETVSKDNRNKYEDIIRRRTGLNETNTVDTLEKIGKDYGVSRERIRQIESKFIHYLKRNKRKLEDFL